MSNNASQQPVTLYVKRVKTIMNPDVMAFDQQVNDFIKAGWLPNGPVTVFGNSLVQSMIKVDENLLAVAHKVMELTAQQLEEAF